MAVVWPCLYRRLRFSWLSYPSPASLHVLLCFFQTSGAQRCSQFLAEACAGWMTSSAPEAIEKAEFVRLCPWCPCGAVWWQADWLHWCSTLTWGSWTSRPRCSASRMDHLARPDCLKNIHQSDVDLNNLRLSCLKAPSHAKCRVRSPCRRLTRVDASMLPYCEEALQVSIVEERILAIYSWLLPWAGTPMGSPLSNHMTSGTGLPSATQVILTGSPLVTLILLGRGCVKDGGIGWLTAKKRRTPVGELHIRHRFISRWKESVVNQHSYPTNIEELLLKSGNTFCRSQTSNLFVYSLFVYICAVKCSTDMKLSHTVMIRTNTFKHDPRLNYCKVYTTKAL